MTVKWILLAIGIAVAILAWQVFGAQVRFEMFLAHKSAIEAAVALHLPWAVAGYIGLYTLVVAFSLPVALPLTLIGGLLFGFALGTLATVTGASLGAVLVFLAARGLLHDYFLKRTEGWLGNIRRAFEADAAGYLLAMRLAPVFPFAVVNLAAALLGTPFRTYLWTTVLGILPGTAAFTLTAAGLADVVDREAETYRLCLESGAATCRATLNPAMLLSRNLLLGLAGLALVMVLSIFLRRWLRRSGDKQR